MLQFISRNRVFFVISFLIILLIFGFIDNEEKLLNYSCGEKPIDFVEIDISNNPNYVFENDPLYNLVKLYDEKENTVLVNSYRECKHYVEGGWFKPSPENNNESGKSNVYKTVSASLLLFIFYRYNQFLTSIKINRNNLINFFPVIFFSIIYLIIYSKLLNRGLYFPLANENQIIKVASLSLLMFFLYLLSKIICEALNHSSQSLSLVYFLLSFFLFDFLLIPFTKNIEFQTSFFIVSFFWLLLFLLKKTPVLNLVYLSFSYLCVYIFNNYYFEIIGKENNYRILNSDVEVQWFPLVSMVHDNNLFYAFENSLIPGYGMLLSYTQAVIHKIIFLNSTYNFSTLDANLILLLSFFLFKDLNIFKQNKIALGVSYFLIILDDGWLRFLMGNSLMLEGLVSFLFATFVINISKAKLQKASVAENSFFILFLSLLIFSKQFIETIVLIVLIYIFLVIRDKISTLPFLVIIFINQIYNRIYFNSLIDIEYIDRPLSEIILDIVLLKNANWQNVNNIVLKVFEYKFIFFSLILIILFFKYTNDLSQISSVLIAINLFLIVLLYVFVCRILSMIHH
ncbi:hypothetical protein CM15mP35_09130 [bacterium]|nr:MAG: hypothetical protein CM15mP35_09130 [bacterium]